MKSHTPGPWKVNEFHHMSEVRDNLGALLCVLNNNNDAHLIAASPELFDAVKELVAEWDTQHADDNYQTGIYPESEGIRRARAAIAKADGR